MNGPVLISILGVYEQRSIWRACAYTQTRLNIGCSTVLLDFSLNVKAATLIFISGCGSAISSAKEGKSGFIYNLVKS